MCPALQPGRVLEVLEVNEAYREPLGSVHFNHAAQKVLTVRRDEVRHVENSQLHLLQQIPQVVVVERQGALEKRESRKHVTNMSAELLHIYYLDYRAGGTIGSRYIICRNINRQIKLKGDITLTKQDMIDLFFAT